MNGGVRSHDSWGISMTRINTARFWLYHGLLPLALFILLVLVFEVSGLDLGFSDFFYDFDAGRWLFKNSWWTEQLIHRGGRKLILFIALASLAAWALSFRLEKLRRWRRAALYLTLAIGVGTGLVAFGKAAINRHCPWDYDRYGGPVPYSGLFEPAPPGCTRGNCFPAGHASGGFSLMSSYFIFYGRSRGRAIAGLLAGLALGSLFGFGQVARGAHFVSHNLWTAAVCWFSALALYQWVFHGRLLVPGAGHEKD
jgi:membrane-associated PAP2 superfamily phosphatase